jgi:3-isopropylmalate/(R)-2-methylmalate dehydratase small subunit
MTAIEPIEGRTWVFPEASIDTDQIMPSETFRMAPEEQVRRVFASYRPGWVDQVEPGDVLVAGRNFGTGSSRPGARFLARLGVVALVAESVNDVFFRNCDINYALPTMECPGIIEQVREGDVITVDLAEGACTNIRTGVTLRGTRIPAMLWEIIAAGGLYESLRKEGYL